jgi:hypothetical protein
MGVLGEYPRAEMISKLEAEVNKWQKADSSLIAIPFTLHCRNCSRCAGRDNMHRNANAFNKLTLF